MALASDFVTRGWPSSPSGPRTSRLDDRPGAPGVRDHRPDLLVEIDPTTAQSGNLAEHVLQTRASTTGH